MDQENQGKFIDLEGTGMLLDTLAKSICEHIASYNTAHFIVDTHMYPVSAHV